MNRNVGIDILKIVACILVVFLHFGGGIRAGVWAVPIFVVIAGYLSGPVIESNDFVRLRSRLVRLYVPFVFWGVVYSALWMIFNKEINCRVLILQLLLGAPACPVLYFIFILAIQTIVLFLVYRWCPVKFMIGLLVLCFVMEYTGLNFNCFKWMSFYPRHSLGRIVELFPYMITGYMLHREMNINKISPYIACLISAAAIVFGLCCLRFSATCHGFSYQGLPLFCSASGIAVMGVLLGEKVRLPKAISSTLTYMSALTPGVFYMHLFVGKGYEMVVQGGVNHKF